MEMPNAPAPDNHVQLGHECTGFAWNQGTKQCGLFSSPQGVDAKQSYADMQAGWACFGLFKRALIMPKKKNQDVREKNGKDGEDKEGGDGEEGEEVEDFEALQEKFRNFGTVKFAPFDAAIEGASAATAEKSGEARAEGAAETEQESSTGVLDEQTGAGPLATMALVLLGGLLAVAGVSSRKPPTAAPSPSNEGRAVVADRQMSGEGRNFILLQEGVDDDLEDGTEMFALVKGRHASPAAAAAAAVPEYVP